MGVVGSWRPWRREVEVIDIKLERRLGLVVWAVPGFVEEMDVLLGAADTSIVVAMGSKVEEIEASLRTGLRVAGERVGEGNEGHD